MPEAPHVYKNTGARFEAPPRCRERIEFPSPRETGMMRLRASLVAVCAARFPQGRRRGLSHGEFRIWPENCLRHGEFPIRGMGRFRAPAAEPDYEELRAMRHGPRPPEDAARPERRDAGRRIRNMSRSVPVLDPPVRRGPSSTRPHAATVPSAAGGGRTRRRSRADARNAPRPAEAASARAVSPDSRERPGSSSEFRRRGRLTPAPQAGAQGPRTRRERRQAGSRIRPYGGDGRAR